MIANTSLPDLYGRQKFKTYKSRADLTPVTPVRHWPENGGPLSLSLVGIKTTTTMTLVFFSLLLFYGVFFWQAYKMKEQLEQKHHR
jgi:hypothetical protein